MTGPLLSLVFRTEDVWQRYNQYTKTFRSSQSGFPLLTPTMQTVQDSDGGMGGLEGMCTMHAVVVLCFWCRHRTRISRGGLKGAAQRFIIVSSLIEFSNFGLWNLDRN